MPNHQMVDNDQSIKNTSMLPGGSRLGGSTRLAKSALGSRREAEGKGNYTMIGLCFVSDESLDQIKQMKEEMLTTFKQNDSDTYWAKMFVLLITYHENDIDLRLQKVLLQKLKSMAEESIGECNIDAAKYQRLYIARVYEKNRKSNNITEQDEILQNKLKKITISNLMVDEVLCKEKIEHMESTESEDKPMDFIVDKIGLLGFPCNEITLTKFLTIEEQLSRKPSRSKYLDESAEHPL